MSALLSHLAWKRRRPEVQREVKEAPPPRFAEGLALLRKQPLRAADRADAAVHDRLLHDRAVAVQGHRQAPLRRAPRRHGRVLRHVRGRAQPGDLRAADSRHAAPAPSLGASASACACCRAASASARSRWSPPPFCPSRMLGAAAVAVLLCDGFRFSVDKASMELLYLPIPRAVKDQAKPFIDTVVDRVAGALASFLWLFLTWAFHVDRPEPHRLRVGGHADHRGTLARRHPARQGRAHCRLPQDARRRRAGVTPAARRCQRAAPSARPRASSTSLAPRTPSGAASGCAASRAGPASPRISGCRRKRSRVSWRARPTRCSVWRWRCKRRRRRWRRRRPSRRSSACCTRAESGARAHVRASGAVLSAHRRAGGARAPS